MKSKTFIYPITIKEHHLDTFGHVNNATYLTLFEEARWELISENGFGIKDIVKTGLGPVILEIKIVFEEELRVRQKIDIETSMLSYEGKVGKLRQRMLRDGECCCTAEFVFALFNVRERKIIPPTPEWLKAIGVTEK